MKPTHIIMHHSLTKDSNTVSWDNIRKYHVQSGYDTIGYHLGIERINGTLEILTGRMLNETGAHCKQEGMNRKSIGICNVGNFDDVEPGVERWMLNVKLVKSLMEVFNISVENVRGHNEYADYKSCPGNMWDMGAFRLALIM